VVRRGRGRRVLLVGGIQELVEAAGGLTVVAVVVVVVSLDGVDVSIVDGRGVDRPLRHVIQAKRENSDEARTRGGESRSVLRSARLTCRRRKVHCSAMRYSTITHYKLKKSDGGTFRSTGVRILTSDGPALTKLLPCFRLDLARSQWKRYSPHGRFIASDIAQVHRLGQLLSRFQHAALARNTECKWKVTPMCVYAGDFITRSIAFIPDTRFSKPPRGYGEREGKREREGERGGRYLLHNLFYPENNKCAGPTSRFHRSVSIRRLARHSGLAAL